MARSPSEICCCIRISSKIVVICLTGVTISAQTRPVVGTEESEDKGEELGFRDGVQCAQLSAKKPTKLKLPAIVRTKSNSVMDSILSSVLSMANPCGEQ